MPEPLRAVDLTEPVPAPVTVGYDVERIREDFPILQRQIGRWPLVYLDSANTSQKPVQVVEAVQEHYLEHNANVARAMHTLGGEATEAFEGARKKVADFIGAAGPEEIVFTKNASEALNLVAHSLGGRLSPGDEIVISVLEHHSNIVPWQMLAQRTGAVHGSPAPSRSNQRDSRQLDRERARLMTSAAYERFLDLFEAIIAYNE